MTEQTQAAPPQTAGEPQKAPDFFAVPTQLLTNVLQYLASRPYQEVAGLIQGIEQNARPAQPPET